MKPYFEQDGITIYHADAFELLHELEGIDALITDPPYSSGGMFRSDRTKSTILKYVNSDTQANRVEFSGDNRDQRSYLAWASLWLSAALHASNPGAVAAIFTDWRQLPTTTDAIQAGGWVQRGIAVWDKTEAARPFQGGFRSQAEFIVWATSGPADPEANPVCLPGVLVAPSPRGDGKLHIAEKPVDVMGWVCRFCRPRGLIVDPFVGSGTTLLAARNLGYRAIGIDIQERNCETAATRLREQNVLFVGGG